MQLGSTVQLDSHAVAMLRHIRASMDAAVSLAVPGSAVIAAGIIGLLAAVTSSIPSLQPHWLAIWLFAAVVAASLGGALMARQISLRGLAIAGAPIRKFAIGFLPSLFAGAILTAALGFQGNLQIIPAVWLLLYGCALMAASAVTVRTIGFLGASFSLLGIVTFLLPASLHIFMLGLGFGALHVLFGFLLTRVRHGRQT